jgi:hypothetical protein
MLVRSLLGSTMNRRGLVGGLVCAGALAAAGPAATAAPRVAGQATTWSAPASVPAADVETFSGGGFALGPGGGGYLGWFKGYGIGDELVLSRISASGASAPTKLGRKVKVPSDRIGDLVALSGGRLAIAGEQTNPVGAHAGNHFVVQILGGTGTGSVQRVEPADRQFSTGTMVGAPNGRLGVLGGSVPDPLEHHGLDDSTELALDLSSTGGRFGRPVVISEPGAVSAISLAINARGDALAAFELNGELEARWLLADGRLTPTQRIAPLDTQSWTAVALSPSGHAELVWETQNVANPQQPSPASSQTTAAASIAKIGGRFAPPVVLERYPPPTTADEPEIEILGGPARDVVGAAFAGHTPLVAWTTLEPAGFAVRAADLDDPGPSTQTVSPAGVGATLSALAIAPDGTALLAWTATTTTSPSIPSTAVQQVATRPADAAGFAPPTTIPGSQLLGPTNASAAAIDPATGIPIVAWGVAGGIDISHGPAL